MHSKHTHTHIHTDDTLAHEYTQPQSLVFTIRLKYQIYNMTSSIIFLVAGAHTNAHSHPVTDTLNKYMLTPSDYKMFVDTLKIFVQMADTLKKYNRHT